MEKMKVNELRIGSIVTHEDYSSELFEVISIVPNEYVNNSYVINTHGGKNGTWLNDIGLINPVYITKELLMQLGFEKRIGLSINWFLNDDLLENLKWTTSRLYLRVYGYRIEVRSGDCEGTKCIATIKYIHQLQNIFSSLSGEELKFNLNGKDNH